MLYIFEFTHSKTQTGIEEKECEERSFLYGLPMQKEFPLLQILIIGMGV